MKHIKTTTKVRPEKAIEIPVISDALCNLLPDKDKCQEEPAQ
jgi:hypothetical protein